MFFSSQKVEGDGAVTNDTEKGDEDEKEVEGDGDEVEGDNEGGEEAGAAEEKALNENLGDEGDCCSAQQITLSLFIEAFCISGNNDENNDDDDEMWIRVLSQDRI